MFIRDLKECDEFTAGDGCRLRELLHPGKAALAVRYSLAHAVVVPGQATRPHRLAASEVFYIMEGEGVMHINGEGSPVFPGQAIYIPPNAVQNIRNPGPKNLVFLCIVDPAWRKEDEEVW